MVSHAPVSASRIESTDHCSFVTIDPAARREINLPRAFKNWKQSSFMIKLVPRQAEDQVMSNAVEQLEGGCLCGAVRFITTGKPKAIYWCHCQSCRRHTGAPTAVFAVFDCGAYTVTKGEITKFDSTPGRTRRGFCPSCGSTMTCESLPGPMETHFHIGVFDQAAQLQPTSKQYFAEERLPWLHLAEF